MNEFLETKSIPVCHPTFCDYQLSRIDLSTMPFDAPMLQNLTTLVQTCRRRQCHLCHFYVDANSITDFNQHVAFCTLENAVHCTYCHCPQELSHFDEHVRQCRNELMHRQQNLVDFILPRTKYPFNAHQLDFFIEMQKKNHLPIDARSIVEALANFGKLSIFLFCCCNHNIQSKVYNCR